MSRIGAFRDRLVQVALGVPVKDLLYGYQSSLERLERTSERREQDISHLRSQLAAHGERLRAQTAFMRGQRDRVPDLRRGLEELRRNRSYATAFGTPDPLVSVRIASYQRTDALMDIAIPSVLRQTHQNFELIIVNDGPNPRTRDAVASLHDERIRYVEFARRHSYPDDPHSRWMVAGAPGMNYGADLARGDWIAPLDEDDEFFPEHIEVLLRLAQTERVELAYGALVRRNLINGAEERIWSSPPAISEFSFQGAIYLRSLNSLFRYDESSWMVDEPSDWNLIRRMTAAGVSMAATEGIVASMNHIPYTHKDTDGES